jgi:hypothetical protein
MYVAVRFTSHLHLTSPFNPTPHLTFSSLPLISTLSNLKHLHHEATPQHGPETHPPPNFRVLVPCQPPHLAAITEIEELDHWTRFNTHYNRKISYNPYYSSPNATLQQKGKKVYSGTCNWNATRKAIKQSPPPPHPNKLIHLLDHQPTIPRRLYESLRHSALLQVLAEPSSKEE